MKRIIIPTLLAIGVFGLSASANAACPDGASNYPGGVSSFPFATTGISFAVDRPTAEGFTGESYAPYDSDCNTPFGLGIGESTTGEIVDGAVVGEGEYSHEPSITVGPNNSAFGNSSKVYTEETYIELVPNAGPDGIFGNEDDFNEEVERTRIIPVSNGTAIGAKSHVSHDNSTAIGSGSQSTDDHQVTLGTKGETIRAEGVASEKSKARQQGPVEVVTSDSGGRLATDGGEIFNRLGSLENTNAQQWNQIEDNTARLNTFGVRLEDAEKSIAIATAMPDAWLSDSKGFGVFGSVGGAGNETAIGFAAIGRIDQTWSINAKLGADTDFEQFGWQVGAGAQW